jgi:2-polyprenyl-6-methoxyphenol hydroxylase-like FAD-dependent oxidoreductase
MYDVLIVGYGPTGMMAAALLGRAGHKVAVIERYKTLYNLPRVGIVHDDVLRMFQEIGISERVRPATFFLPIYELANHGVILMSSPIAAKATHGWPEYISIYQPAFESELDLVAKSLPTVDVFQGDTAVALMQDSNQVEITTEDENGRRRKFSGRYLIGADGGNSIVREALGIAQENLGFKQDWLVVDAKIKKKRPGIPLYRQFCEPEHPRMTLQMGPEHRRWSFMIFPDEPPEEAARIENVWKRLDRPEGATPDEVDVIRAVAYKFRSLLAERWRVGRVFLAGDAAHQMPPYLAQGLCSGFRDAHNLSWKLDLVLKGLAEPKLLDSYMTERAPVSRATVMESVAVGRNVIERDPEKVKARDARLLALQAAREKAQGEAQLIAFRVPGYEKGLVSRAGLANAAGEAFAQGRVRRDGREGLFDDVAGRGFMIVARNGDPAAVLSRADRDFWTSLGGDYARLTPGRSSTGAELEDIEGIYGKLMDEYRCDVIVKRPDYYIFGACASAAGLPALLSDLRAQLGA